MLASRPDFADRMESVKAGLLSGIVALCCGGLLAPLRPGQEALWLAALASGLCGFLFGITYRYVVRDDSNRHLGSGAVGAFGLVRGLTLLEGQWPRLEPLPVATDLGAVLLPFLCGRLALDAALGLGWIKKA